MSKLDQQIRSKRFKVKNESSLFLLVDFNSGEQVKFKVSDCSQTGLRAFSETNAFADKLPEQGCIVSAAKLTWGQSEYALGRMVFRRAFPSTKGLDFAFSTIDIKLPVAGAISKLLEIQFENLDDGKSEELSSDKFSLAHFVERDRKSTRLNSSHGMSSRMPSSA